MAKHTLKILRCEHRKILKECLVVFQPDFLHLLKKYLAGNFIFCIVDVALFLLKASK